MTQKPKAVKSFELNGLEVALIEALRGEDIHQVYQATFDAVQEYAKAHPEAAAALKVEVETYQKAKAAEQREQSKAEARAEDENIEYPIHWEDFVVSAEPMRIHDDTQRILAFAARDKNDNDYARRLTMKLLNDGKTPAEILQAAIDALQKRLDDEQERHRDDVERLMREVGDAKVALAEANLLLKLYHKRGRIDGDD